MKRILTPAFLMTLLLLVVGGIVTGYFIKKLFAREETRVVAKTQDVPMAIATLEPGTLITAAHLGKGPALVGKLERDDARTERVVVGRVVKNRIERAQPISVNDLYAPGEFPTLKVAPGMKAVSVSLKDGQSALRGIVRPGSRVDVHFTPSRTPDLSRTGGWIMTLFKGVKILALDASTAYTARPGARIDNSVTLELTAAQANVVLLAKDKGALGLTSTNETDNTGGITVSDADRVTLDQILGIKEPEERKEKPSTVTEVYTGAGRRIQVLKEGKRLDLYGIENFDYNRRNGNGYGVGGWGGVNGYGAGSAGYGGYGTDRNTFDQGATRYGGGGGSGYGGGGYYSVPAGQNGQGQGQNGNAGGAAGAGGFGNGEGSSGGGGFPPGA